MTIANLPGIPPLSGGKGITGLVTLAAPLTNNLLDKFKPQWGIYDATGKKKMLYPDSFLSIDYHNEMNISTYPIEEGSFASYNKVRTPFNATVKVSKGGSNSDRKTFISALDALLSSLDLYTIVTPEAVYFNVSVENYDFKRDNANGAGMITAAVRLVEIMQATAVTTTGTTFTTPPDPLATIPSAQSLVNYGMKQATALASPFTGPFL